MYDVYLDKMLCPLPPKQIEVKIESKNKTIILINDGEVNLVKKAGLTEVSFDIILPNVPYPFARYKSGFKRAKYFLKILERLKQRKTSFKFKVLRELPSGRPLHNTSMRVTLESYTVKDDAEEGFDVAVSIKLRQFKPFGTKTVNIQPSAETGTPASISKPEPQREATNAPQTGQNYTVKKGDCLYNIAKRFYGNGAQWEKIYAANPNVCGKPYKKGGITYVLIKPGDVLTIP